MKNTIKSIKNIGHSEEQKRFISLCAEDESALPPESIGLGTYNEKRIHRILKKFVCDDENCHEVKLGRYVADVLESNRITEIQTAGFTSLNAKIRFYLENTDYNVTVIHPMIAEKTIIRADKESGELFINGGERAVTSLIPTPLSADGITFAADAPVTLSVEAHHLK